MSSQPEMKRESEITVRVSKLETDASSDEKLAQRLREQPLTVLKEYGVPVSSQARELSHEELGSVTGGLKYDPNYVSQDTIDARGGQQQIGPIIVTYDINGKISSASYA